MKRVRITTVLFALCVLLHTASVLTAVAAQYEARDLGPIAGFGYGFKINNNGQIIEAGSARVWSADGSYVDLGSIWPDEEISTYDINDAGEVAVYVSGEAYRWRESEGFVRLSLIPGEQKSCPDGINENGDVVGWFVLGYVHACVWWADGTAVDLGLGSASDMNDYGEAVGRRYPEPEDPWDPAAVVWSPDGTVTLIGGTDYSPEAINNAGEVVGRHIGIGHAFRWTQSGGVEYLQGLGVDGSAAYSINQDGQIVGWANVAVNNPHAVIWDVDLQPTDLGALPGFAYSKAYDLNDSGWIVGCSSTTLGGGGDYHLTLWVPVPEPSALAALLCGLGGVLLRRWR